MKKIAIVFLAACLLFASSRNVSHAATTVPTVSWNLVPTAYMEQIGIFTDPVNHRGIYNYTAVITAPSFWYSPYYYIASAASRFYFCGYSTTNPINHPVLVRMQNKFNDYFYSTVLDESDQFFVFDFGTSYYTNAHLSDKAYFLFGVDSYPGVSITFNGGLETY